MSLIEQYKQLHKTILERAVYINNLIKDMPVRDDLAEYKPNRIYGSGSDLVLSVEGNELVLSYYESYENYTEYWKVSEEYLDMSDEDIKQDWIKWAEHLHEAHLYKRTNDLKREAELLGYELVKK